MPIETRASARLRGKSKPSSKKAPLADTPPKRKANRPARAGRASKKGPKRGCPPKLPARDIANNHCTGHIYEHSTVGMAAMTALPELVSPSWSDLRHYGRKLMDMTPPTSIKKATRRVGGAELTLTGRKQSPGAAIGPLIERVAKWEPIAGSPSGILGIKAEFRPSQ